MVFLTKLVHEYNRAAAQGINHTELVCRDQVAMQYDERKANHDA